MKSDSEGQRSVLSGTGRFLLISEVDRDLIRLAQDPNFERWLTQVRRTGGCSHPIHLSGRTTKVDPRTGAVIADFDTASEPGERILIRCGNRRHERCQPCSYVFAGDSFHLIRSGLMGGKGVPIEVSANPMVFVTLTAPSFGAVHRLSNGDTKCACLAEHAEGESLVGQPIHAHSYDYSGHALWNSLSGELWNRTIRNMYRECARVQGIPKARLRDHLTLSYAKVAEYQKRGAIHFHAIIRADGPSAFGQAPPVWIASESLTSALTVSVRRTEMQTPYSMATGEHCIHWGNQMDVHSIEKGDGYDGAAVASYVAKYVTKSVSGVGGVDHAVKSAEELELLPVTPHVRALMAACQRLGSAPGLEALRLSEWAHALGYRGHVLTKSRGYSTTYKALRKAREDFRNPSNEEVASESYASWRYVGSGYSPGEDEIARGVAQDLAVIRDLKRDI
ncbi:replication initiator [Streptomyces sp. NPDC051561]|uniref:replication initiator n=1 Tax=Streptomyces sp. NPDC051561 TaxID=3365658 RepID=UPI00379626C0